MNVQEAYQTSESIVSRCLHCWKIFAVSLQADCEIEPARQNARILVSSRLEKAV